MKQVSSDKYNVAWFRLAECVSRGEKERALGVYRLLSHSLDDPALVVQLEADILWAFNDKQALEKYQEAAELYKKDQRMLEAASVYEHLITMKQESVEYLGNLIELYDHLSFDQKGFCCHEQMVFALLKDKESLPEKIVLHIKKAIEGFMQHNKTKELQQFLSKLQVVHENYYQEAIRYIKE